MYEYDLFVSYKREPKDNELMTPWLRKVLKRIEYYLRQEMGGRRDRARLFLDVDGIEAGEVWPEKIRHALQSARCLMPIWSPEYFHSDWCVAEWRSFLAREQLVVSRGQGACRLIVPIKFHDGTWFPPEAASVEQFDLRDYAATTEAFWDTKRADELDQILRTKVAPTLARAIAKAPDFDSAWPVDLGNPTVPPNDVRMIRL